MEGRLKERFEGGSERLLPPSDERFLGMFVDVKGCEIDRGSVRGVVGIDSGFLCPFFVVSFCCWIRNFRSR